MEKYLLKVLLLSLLFYLVSCLSFGTYQIESEIYSSEQTEILIWNREEKDFFISLEVVEKPKGWEIFIYPNNAIFSSLNSYGKFYNFDVKKIFIYFICNECESGNAKILLKASSLEEGIKVFQVREFNYKLFSKKIVNKSFEFQKINQTFFNVEIKNLDLSFVILIAIVLILIVFLLKRKSYKVFGYR